MARLLYPAGEVGLPGAYGDQRSEIPLPETSDPVELATGEAGDVYLCHPFLVHAAGWPHPKTAPRFHRSATDWTARRRATRWSGGWPLRRGQRDPSRPSTLTTSIRRVAEHHRTNTCGVSHDRFARYPARFVRENAMGRGRTRQRRDRRPARSW